MEKLIRAIVKAAVKSVSPVLADLLDAGAGTFLDARDSAKAADIAGRLIQRTRESVVAWLTAEGLGAEALEPVTPVLEAVAATTGQVVRSWHEAGFDAERAADTAMVSHDRLLAAYSDPERRVCRATLIALFNALGTDTKALEATETEFRRGVLSGLADLGRRLTSLTDRDQQALAEAVKSAVLSLHVLPWRADWSPPGALLRADIDDPVPFHGREQEVNELLHWCRADASIVVRLYTGAGGIGKTRLLREVVRQMRLIGWQGGFVDSALVEDASPFWRALVAGAEGRLYVIDYAETRRHVVIRLLRELLCVPGMPQRRLVLLARAADEWWDHLRSEGQGVGDLLSSRATQTIPLGPLALTPELRRQSYGLAATHFARKLGQPIPQRVPDDLEREEYGRALLLHMAALAAVEGTEVRGDQGILHYVLARERRFWSTRIEDFGIPRHLHRGIGRVMAVITLAGGVHSREEAMTLIGRVPFFADQSRAIAESVAQLLHETYPGTRWVEPILPDLLGEQLCQEELEEDPDALLSMVLGERAQ
jgi:hypothetical protein